MAKMDKTKRNCLNIFHTSYANAQKNKQRNWKKKSLGEQFVQWSKTSFVYYII